ncbi:MAG TPA: stage II sporulation protein D [Firmicutes bacterium]|nr:stage II sporulation protein D [Bacillota bacterium]
MRRIVFFVVAFCFVVVIVLPSLIALRGCSLTVPPAPPLASSPEISVYVEAQKKIVKMPLEQYLLGVVAAEMPASFALEALKAQAVAARTFALKRMRAFGGQGCPEHPGADVCTDHRHCQAWKSADDMRRMWGYFEFIPYYYKVSQAVKATEGYVITYQGKLIDAAYHSNCGGATDDAADVWSAPVPYLRGKPCNFHMGSQVFREQKAFSLEELERRLGVSFAVRKVMTQRVNGRTVDVISRVPMAGLVDVIAQSPQGRVKTIRIGDKIFNGADLRDKLGLRSTRLSWRISGNEVLIQTTGYGHGVGMCQYGADGMARQGKSFEDILKYYYTGVEVVRLTTGVER